MTDTALVPATNGHNVARPPVDDGPPVVPTPQALQYMTNFDGMASAPFPDAAIKALTAPIDPKMIEIKPDGICYLPGVFYRQRLTEAFGPGGWALAPRGPARVMGNLVTYHAALYVSGRFVSEAVGECQYHANNGGMTYASALEGARTDALTRCCKDLLVAKELWDPSFREKWIAEYALKKWLTGDGKKKAGFFYWRKDRETPWQAQKSNEPAEPGRSMRGADDGPDTSTDPEGRNDGKPEDTLAEVEAALRTVGYKGPHKKNWLSLYFGVQLPSDLSKDQQASAIQMLYALSADGQDPRRPKYAAKVKELQDAGKINQTPPKQAK